MNILDTNIAGANTENEKESVNELVESPNNDKDENVKT